MMSEQLEALAAELHEVYEVEINRQGRVSGHPAHYSNLSEQVKDLDRALARFILNRDRELAEELRAPMACGHPKACQEWNKSIAESTQESPRYLVCTACAEIEAAVTEMRERAARQLTESHLIWSEWPVPIAEMNSSLVCGEIEKRIRALPLSAPPEAGGER